MYILQQKRHNKYNNSCICYAFSTTLLGLFQWPLWLWGFFFAFSTLAMTLGTGTTALLPSMEFAFALAAFLSVVVVILWILFIHEKEEISIGEEINELSAKESIIYVLKNKNIYLIGSILACVMISNVTISSFLATAIAGSDLSQARAGSYASFYTFGSMIGCLVMPILYQKTDHKSWMLIILICVGALGTIFTWNLPIGIVLQVGLMITGASIGALMPILISMPIKLSEIESRYAGTAGGCVISIQLIGAVIVPTYILVNIA